MDFVCRILDLAEEFMREHGLASQQRVVEVLLVLAKALGGEAKRIICNRLQDIAAYRVRQLRLSGCYEVLLQACAGATDIDSATDAILTPSYDVNSWLKMYSETSSAQLVTANDIRLEALTRLQAGKPGSLLAVGDELRDALKQLKNLETTQPCLSSAHPSVQDAVAAKALVDLGIDVREETRRMSEEQGESDERSSSKQDS